MSDRTRDLAGFTAVFALNDVIDRRAGGLGGVYAVTDAPALTVIPV